MQSQKADDSWSFKELSRTQTSYLTHGYHRYAAKFIPQLVERLIKENSQNADLVCDPFMGSGTTLVEAIINGRRAYGTDINPVAVLISRAKTTPIEPLFLKHHVSSLLGKIKSDIESKKGQKLLVSDDIDINVSENKRLDYWFPEKQKKDLVIILSRIYAIDDQKVQTFLLCAFSNILKACSRWMMKSVKPTRDKNKAIANAYKSFILQTRRMIIGNEEFWKRVNGKEVNCRVDNSDARKMKIKDGSITLIVTSPPYVTSYEYADLHQLTTIWLENIGNMSEFRSKFLRSIQKCDNDDDHGKLYSDLGRETVNKLRLIDKRESNDVERYFYEMQQSFQEMHRVLKQGGRASIVIGDTDLKKVKIKNSEVFAEIMQEIGFKVRNIILRPIPIKILPLTRDERTGRFSSKVTADRLAYPTESILIMEKI